MSSSPKRMYLLPPKHKDRAGQI